MTILRMEGNHAVHAEFSAPGMWSKVTSVQVDNRTLVYHTVQDEASYLNLAKAYEVGDFQVRQNSNGSYMLYASKKDSDLHEFLKRHRALVDMWNELYRTEGDSLETAIRQSARNKHQERNAGMREDS
jgi:hypothetical protein